MIRLIQNSIFIAGTAAAAVYGYHRYVDSKPCVEPIKYSVGTIDSRFNVSKDDFIADMQKAGGIWDSAAGKDLFEYDPKASLTISLVYDSRQQITQKEIQTKAVISQTKQTASSAKNDYLASKVKYENEQKTYLAAVATLTSSQDAYNKQVEYWNSKGGAPAKEYADLQNQKAALMTKQASVEGERLKVNQLAEDTNALIQKYNALVDDVNGKVATINNDGLAGTQFEEGVYISDEKGKRIEIYQFDNQTTFIRVLAHEMGHALGLEHNSNQESIMSPVNSGSTLKLTVDDMTELKTLCKI